MGLLILILAIIVVVFIVNAIDSIKRTHYKNNLFSNLSTIENATKDLKTLLDITQDHWQHSNITIDSYFLDESNYGNILLFTKKYGYYDSISTELLKSKYASHFPSEKKKLEEYHYLYSNFPELRKKHDKLRKDYLSITRDDLLTTAIQEINDLEKCEKYFTESEKNIFLENYKAVINVLALAKSNPELAKAIGRKNDCEKFSTFYNNINDNKTKINNTYINKELSNNEKYFESVLRFPLSEQQRNSIVIDEDNVLVISSAGSGKTFTMEGKVKYLIEKKGVEPSKILLLTFTRKAAESLHQRVGIDNVNCSTFDALANEIVTRQDGHRPSICDDKNIREEVFNNLLQNKQFLVAITNYFTLFATDHQAEFSVGNIEQLVAVRKATDRRTLLPCMDGHVVFTKSEQERIIGDILAKNGVAYKYEEPYEIKVSDSKHHQYKPDFSIHYAIKEKYDDVDEDGNAVERERIVQKRVYLEHFAIDMNGNVPKWFVKGGETYDSANKKYNDGIIWKRNLHAQKDTILLETTSGDFQQLGPEGVETKIINLLRENGVPIHPLEPKQIIEYINTNNSKRFHSLKQLLSSFVSLFKGGCHNLDIILNKLKEEISNLEKKDRLYIKSASDVQNKLNKKRRDFNVLNQILIPYLKEYENTLKERKEFDFNDIIHTATQYNNNKNKRYDYILIDEFQDLSIIRYKFVQSLRSEEPFKTKLFCVGDDWQSIYRFAGSDLALFNNFKEYFGFVKECKIEKTYRFGEPLMSISSRFVMENTTQVKKNVTCTSGCITELKTIPYKLDKDNILEDQEKLYNKICSILDNIPNNETVYFLGRYKFDADTLKDIGFKVSERGERYIINYSDHNIVFMTVHQAKGLEADHIILLNCNDGTYGFPSAIEDDPILSYVLSGQEQFKFAEERRLFYVAITRAKKQTNILYDEEHPSYFLKKYITVDGGEYGTCPLCHTGKIVRFQQKVVSNGKIMTEFRCSNERYGCYYNNVKWDNRLTQTIDNNNINQHNE